MWMLITCSIRYINPSSYYKHLKIIASVIARQNSKRLTYKNLLPYKGVPLVLRAVRKLLDSGIFDEVVLSTDSELIGYTCMQEKGLTIIHRPAELCGDDVASVPVFRHILEVCPADLHLNYNCNFPECDESVFKRAIDLALEKEEALSVPYAVWAQTKECLLNYGDPFEIKATTFEDKNIGKIDIHTMEDLIQVHHDNFEGKPW
jgi:CMP-2-keto-3-deoxyoctulosonic acid synthetase